MTIPQAPSDQSLIENTSYNTVETLAAEQGLAIYGALQAPVDDRCLLGSGTLVLLGTASNFWPLFKDSPEFLDQETDPIDRWSARVIGDLAQTFGANPFFPSDGPPYPPFVQWALASGRAFTSPSQMLVHDTVGMMISFRGALHFEQSFDIPPPLLAHSPCKDCASRPCLSICPAQALVDGGPYQLATCHRHLETPAGTPCLTEGCLARRACPLSLGAERQFEQNAHHMRYFHPS